jgi:hypothetical protein
MAVPQNFHKRKRIQCRVPIHRALAIGLPVGLLNGAKVVGGIQIIAQPNRFVVASR